MSNDAAVAFVRVTNRGDEPAHGVHVEARLGDVTARSGACPELAVDASFNAELALGAKPDVPGRYAVPVKIAYADANAYPFSAVYVEFLATQEPSGPELVAGVLSPATLLQAGELVLNLKTQTGQPADVDVRLWLPDELLVETAARNVTVFPGRIADVRFPVRNFGALPGSTYAVAATVSYVDRGEQRSFAAPAWVSIQQPRPILAHWIWLAVAGLLVAAFLFVQWRQRPAAGGSPKGGT